MPADMLFEYATLKLLFKTFFADLKPSHSYNTRNENMQIKKTSNKRGERSLLCTGSSLYNKYIQGGELATRALTP